MGGIRPAPEPASARLPGAVRRPQVPGLAGAGPAPARPIRPTIDLDLTAVPAFGGMLVQRCGGMPEPCACHPPEAGDASASGGVVRQRHDGSANGPSGVPAEGGAGPAGPALAGLIRGAVADPGAPVNPPARAELESSLGADLASVRVHTGPAADASAARLHASAYTLGEHIVLRGGGRPLGTSGDRRTLAHEVAHVLQQRRRAAPDSTPSPAASAELRIGDPGDRLEREADATADAVMARRAAPALGAGRADIGGSGFGGGGFGGSGWTISAPHDPDERAAAQHAERAMVRLAAAPAAAAPATSAASAIPEHFGHAFGHDFTRVRVHTDASAADITGRVNASAVTVGRQIYFAPGRYQPHTSDGRQLLAHELSHVVQHDHDPRPRVRRQFLGCADLLATPGDIGVLSGIAVHRLIQADFVASVPAGSSTTIIPGASAGALRSQGICGGDTKVIPPQKTGGGAGPGKPDLARQNPAGVLSVAEIKPAAEVCLVDGEEQLARYVDQGNAKDPEQLAWRQAEGISVVVPMLPDLYPGRTLDAVVARVQTEWCTPGLLGYAVYPKRRRRRKKAEDQPRVHDQPEQKRAAEQAAKDRPGVPVQPDPDRREAPGRPAEPQQATDSPPAGSPGPADSSAIPELLAAAAVLAAAARRQGIQAAERAALEAAYKRTMVQLAERGAVQTAERLMINGVKLGSRALEDAFAKRAAAALEQDIERMSAEQLKRLAIKEGEVLLEREAGQVGKAAAKGLAKRLAGKTLAKAVPYLGVLLIASDALAAADHVSKGGTIEFGLSGSNADLSGATDIKGHSGAPKATATTTAKLTDTVVDIETSGIPDISGSIDIQANKVTITGASRGDGTPVTVNFKATLSNSTIVIKHAGVLRGGRVLLGGDVTIKDSQVEIDIGKEMTDAPPASGAPIVISGRKLTVTKAGGSGGGSGGGSDAPAAPPPATTPAPAPPATAALGQLSAATRAKVSAAGKGAEALIAALMITGTTGLKVDDASVEAILRVLTEQRVTPEELEKLRARVTSKPATTLDALLATLSENIQQLRPAAAPAPPGVTTPPGTATQPAPATTAGPPAAAVKPLDPADKRFDFLKKGQQWIGKIEKKAIVQGAKIDGLTLLGKNPDGSPYVATVSILIKSVRGQAASVEIVESTMVNTVRGPQPSKLVGQVLPMEIN